MKPFAVVLSAVLLGGCVTPGDLTDAVVRHEAFPTFAVAVQGCISDRPDVQRAITPAWNRTFDKWEATRNLRADVNMLHTLAGSPAKFAEAEVDALFIEKTIVDAGLDCGPLVRDEWRRIKTTFSKIKSAIQSNQTFIAVADYAALLSAIIQGRPSAIPTRMPPA